MRVAILFALLLNAGCSPCASSRNPTVEIGTGERGFIALDPDAPAFELVYGPQGGWHVVLAFAAKGLSVPPQRSIVTIDSYGTIGDEVVAAMEGAWATFECDREVGAQLSWNTLLIFDVLDPSPLHRAQLEVESIITDSRGRTAVGTSTAIILDPTREG